MKKFTRFALLFSACLSNCVVLATAHNPTWSSYISSLIETAESVWLRIALTMVLGLLLSLTPCIYPMIPITIGILQAQGSRSLWRNFALALAYTIGIATTFACLGLIAAYSGNLFGNFMTQPAIIIPIVLLLAYLAGSTMGLYEMYTPRILQGSHTHRQNGSLLGAFLFGAASGTVASPCLSPGLLLLLSIVTTLGSYLQGFLLLFFFGIGLSIPLLIIGTCSGALTILPRAGMWMVEIKKLFGLVILAMCFYFLQNIMSYTALLRCAGATAFCLSFFYIWTAQKAYGMWHWLHYGLAVFFGLSSVYIWQSAYQQTSACTQHATAFWHTDYATAKELAQRTNRPLLVDITAPYCSICKAIEKKLFADCSVQEIVQAYIPVKIDCSQTDNTVHQAFIARHKIAGAPTFLIVDANDDTVIARWGSELYNYSVEECIELLKNHIE